MLIHNAVFLRTHTRWHTEERELRPRSWKEAGLCVSSSTEVCSNPGRREDGLRGGGESRAQALRKWHQLTSCFVLFLSVAFTFLLTYCNTVPISDYVLCWRIWPTEIKWLDWDESHKIWNKSCKRPAEETSSLLTKQPKITIVWQELYKSMLNSDSFQIYASDDSYQRKQVYSTLVDASPR